MALVTYDPYEIREARDATKFNTVQTDFVAAAIDLRAQNIAEEGIDRSRMVGAVSADRAAYITESTRQVVQLGTTPFQTLVITGSPTTFRTGALTLAVDEIFRIRYRIWLETTAASGVGLTPTAAAAATFLARVAYLPNGGGTTAIAESQRGAKVAEAGAGAPEVSHANISGLTYLLGSAGALTLDWIELQYSILNFAGAHPSRAMFEIMRFKAMS